MQKTKFKLPVVIGFVLVASILTGCMSMALFDEYVYKETISVKVDAQLLMAKATTDYTNYQKDVEDLLANVQKLYEYEKGRSNNVETIKMWELMLNPDKNMLAGFMKRWQDKGKMGKMFVEEAQKQVKEAFDIIIGLETHKLKKEKVNEFLAK